jgi:hypothetical protein
MLVRPDRPDLAMSEAALRDVRYCEAGVVALWAASGTAAETAASPALPTSTTPTIPSTVSTDVIVPHLRAQQRETWSIAKWLEKDADADRADTMTKLGLDELPPDTWSAAQQKAFEGALLEWVQHIRNVRDHLRHKEQSLPGGEQYPNETADWIETKAALGLPKLRRQDFRAVRQATVSPDLLRRGARRHRIV